MKRVTSLDVACPSCGSSPGRVCWELGGGKQTTPHLTRRRRAREEQARLNPEHSVGQQPLWTGPGPS